MLLFAPSLWPRFALREIPFGSSLALRSRAAGHAALTALPHYYRDPDFSPRFTQAFRSLPYSLAYPSGSSALRLEYHRREHDEISPGQTPLFLSVPPAHTLSRSTLRKYFLRLKAAGSVKRAHGRPVRLWLAPRLRPGDSTHALRIPSRDGHPALPMTFITGPPGLARLCLRFPLARVRRDFHPLEKRPAGRTTLIRHYFEPAKTMSPTAVGNRTLPRGPPRNPLKVMFRAVGACEQPVRSGARGLWSHRLRSLLSVRNFCRIRAVRPAGRFSSG